jgi:hypothetical protein
MDEREVEMQVMSNGRVRRSEAEWREIVSRWRKSGQKPASYCRREQLQLASFLRWQRKLNGPCETDGFVPVTTSSEPVATAWRLEITLPNGCELRFEG